MIVYLDTNCVIYFVENHPLWWPKVVARVGAFRSAKDELATGDLTRAECLVVSFKNGDVGLEMRYRAFFNDPDFRVFEMPATVCERAARLRATYPLKLPDALSSRNRHRTRLWAIRNRRCPVGPLHGDFRGSADMMCSQPNRTPDSYTLNRMCKMSPSLTT